MRAPIELAVAVARGGVEAGVAVARAAWGLIGGEQERPGPDAAAPAPAPARPAAAPTTEPSTPAPARSGPPPPPPRAAEPAPAAQPAPPPEPAHVSEEPVVVAEVAEAGAEDGAGPELEIEPPWEGYDRQDVRAISERLGSAGAAAVAAVELYESAHKGRRGVLDAARRRLKQLSGPAPAGNR